MTQEEKQLLLKDLCARLPYGIYIYHENYDRDNPEKLDTIYCDSQLGDYGFQCCVDNVDEDYHNIEKIKPYLRPMSSMTEKEKEELEDICTMYNGGINTNWESFGIEILQIHPKYGDSFCQDFTALDWLNAHHFDYRGLIEKGLALAAPEDMYQDIVL